MSTMVRYRSLVADSARWEGFEFRDGDIVISTPPKCGTTWTQRICALLVFGPGELDRPIDIISPWLDQQTKKLDTVLADLEGQTHRRFIKTHTPLDGIPFDKRATYVAVGRDPRDVAISWANHMDNLDLIAFMRLIDEGVGFDAVADLMTAPPPGAGLTDPRERFWLWVDDPTPPSDTLSGLGFTLHHLSTFWNVRDEPNVVLMHYGEMTDDLEGQIRRLANELAIDVDEATLPELARQASFDEMRSKATKVAPNSTEPIWLNPTEFFHSGKCGQWRDVLDADGLSRYAARVAELADPVFAEWAHRGPIT